jgi:hypothetical protein
MDSESPHSEDKTCQHTPATVVPRPHKRAKTVVPTTSPTTNFAMLTTAAREGDLDRFKQLFHGHWVADDSDRTPRIKTLIQTACSANHLPVLAFLRSAATDDNDRFDLASHALSCALDEDRSAWLVHLRDDWNVHQRDVCKFMRDHFESWCQNTTAVRKLCVLKGVWDISAEDLLSVYARCRNIPARMLHGACYHNAHPNAPCPRVKIVHELYAQWGAAYSNFMTSADSYACLKDACKASCTELIDEFHAHWGLTSELFRVQHCQILLNFACDYDNVDMVRHLKRVFELDVKVLFPDPAYPDGASVLKHACLSGAVNVLAHFHEEWNLTTDHIRFSRNTVLRAACRRNQVAIVRVLRERFGLTRADVLENHSDKVYYSIFAMTVELGHTELLQEFKNWNITRADLHEISRDQWRSILFGNYRSLYIELQDHWGWRIEDTCYENRLEKVILH